MNRTTWFKRLGWFYCPYSIPGIFIALCALAFCAQVFLAIDKRSHSVTDTLYGIFPFWVGSFFLYDWIATRTAGKADEN